MLQINHFKILQLNIRKYANIFAKIDAVISKITASTTK